MDLDKNIVDLLFKSDTTSLELMINDEINSFLSSKDDVDPLRFGQIKSKFLNFNIQQNSISYEQYLNCVRDEILPHCSHLASPTYLGHMTSPLPNFMPVIGKMVQALNQNMMKSESCRGLTFLERQVLGIFHKEVFSLDDEFYSHYLQDTSTTLGLFTSGGTIANITAIWIAFCNAVNGEGNRHKILWEQGYKDAVIIGSELMHYSFEKGANLMGLSLIRLPTNKHNQLNIQDLIAALNECKQQQRKVIMIVGIAGTTDYGSVDSLDKLYEIAHGHNIHMHVDGAWGGSLVLCDQARHLLNGIEKANSVTIDGHKQLMLPIGCGMLFLKNPSLSKSIMHHAPYAVRNSSVDQGRFSIEGTRPAMALYLHAAINLIGRQGYNTLFSKSLNLTKFMANRISESKEFELASEPTMNILLFRYLPSSYREKNITHKDNNLINEFNIKLQKYQRKVGRTFVSRTFRTTKKYGDQSLVLLRAVLLNPLTTEQNITEVLDELLFLGKELELKIGDF